MAILLLATGSILGRIDYCELFSLVCNLRGDSPIAGIDAHTNVSVLDSDSLQDQTEALLGIDVSHYQGDIDWAKVKASGIRFAYIKASEGAGFTDPKYHQNLKGAKSAGLRVGAYHFFRPEVSGVDQASHFLDILDDDKTDLPPAVDVETTGNVDQSTRVNRLKAFLTQLKSSTACSPVIYTDRGFWDAYMGTGFIEYPLWIAEVTSARTPTLPSPWTNWVIWQHEHHGSVAGISGFVDLDKTPSESNVAGSLICRQGG